MYGTGATGGLRRPRSGSPPALRQLPDKARVVEVTHRLRSSSILGLPYRILNVNPKKELYYGAAYG